MNARCLLALAGVVMSWSCSTHKPLLADPRVASTAVVCSERAQVLEAEVVVTVRDTEGVALPSVTVALLSPDGQPLESTASDADGRSQFRGLKSGVFYGIRATLAGFHASEARGIPTLAGCPTRVQLTLGIDEGNLECLLPLQNAPK